MTLIRQTVHIVSGQN